MSRQRNVYRNYPDRYEDLVRAEDADSNLAATIGSLLPRGPVAVLDIGAGTGRMTRLLEGSLDRDSACVAIDVEESMLAHGRRLREMETGAIDRVSAVWAPIVADARALPVPAGVFDVAIAGWVFGHICEWSTDSWQRQIGLAVEQARVAVRSGGLVAVVDSGRVSPPPRRPRSFWRVVLPEHVHDHPVAIHLGEVHVVDPRCRRDSRAGRATEDVQNPDFVLSFSGRYVGAATATRALHQRHGTHLDETAPARCRVRRHVSFCKLGMERSLHSRAICRVPPVDVVERGRPDFGRVGTRLRRGWNCNGGDQQQDDRRTAYAPHASHSRLRLRLVSDPAAAGLRASEGARKTAIAQVKRDEPARRRDRSTLQQVGLFSMSAVRAAP
jgi:ubiquinone/menaquinone biosynthesis C-methylase UbiE